jgi:hypothetical protein
MATNPFTSAQAGPSFMGGQTLTNPEIIALERQRKMAEMLLKRGMQGQPESEMVSGYYVAPSWAQRLSPVVDQLLGQQGLKDVDEKTAKLAEMLRKKESEDLSKFFELQYGGAPMEAQAGPMPDGGNIPINLSQPDPRAAFEMGMQSSSPLIRSQIAEMLKPQKLSAEETMTRYNPNTGRNEVVAQGTPKFRAPIQIDTGTAIELRDPANPTVVLQTIPKSQMPAAGQVSEDGTYLIDTRSGRTTPIMGAGGQPLTGGGKPLTESQGKASAFQSQMVSASNAVNTLESQGFDPTSFASQTAVKLAGGAANPAIPVAAQQYKQAQDQWSEAYLRFKTGAAATEPEVVRNNRTFFPVFGDKPDQIAQKAAAREQAERDIGIAAGRGSMLGAKPIGQQPKQPPAARPSNLPNQSAIDAELKRRGL